MTSIRKLTTKQEEQVLGAAGTPDQPVSGYCDTACKTFCITAENRTTKNDHTAYAGGQDPYRQPEWPFPF